MDIFDRIRLLPEVLENKIYKYVYFMSINNVNKEFNDLITNLSIFINNYKI